MGNNKNDYAIDGKGNYQVQEEDSNNKVLTVTEVAGLLRLHRSSISRLAKSGELKSYQIGNRRLFKSEDVWMFFENQVASECVSEMEVL